MRIRKYAAAAVMTVALSGVVAFATPAVASPPVATTTTAGEVSPMNSCKDKALREAQYHSREAVRANERGDKRLAEYHKKMYAHYRSVYNSCKG